MPKKTEKKKKIVSERENGTRPFPDVGLDHTVLCDKQATETVQTVADPPGKAPQLHT